MMYVDGYVLAVPEKDLDTYREVATQTAKVYKKHGAIEYVECVADDIDPDWVGMKFRKMMEIVPGETVVFSYIVYNSREHRDEVNANVIKEMGKPEPEDMALWMKRVAYGGFNVIVE